MNSLVGKTLHSGKYSLEQQIGQGGFGITFRATHCYLAQPLVIKTLNEVFCQHPDFPRFRGQFQDEARRLALCLHPNIVRVIDFFEEAEMPYLVMEYIPGDTLKTVVFQGQPLSEAIAIHYIYQIGAALKVVHEQNLLHRDVKPDNIILRHNSDEVVLIDFGIAREFTPGVTQTHTSLVSEGYAPIEQYLDREKRTPATDVYALAATLYTLLTARVPTSAVLRNRQPMPAPRDLRSDISIAVNQAVMRGMAVEPQYRPATVDEWLALLPEPDLEPETATPTQQVPPKTAATIALIPQQPQPVKPPPQPRKRVSVQARSRFPAVLLGGGVGLLALLAIGAAAVMRDSLQPSPQPLAQPIPSETPQGTPKAQPSPTQVPQPRDSNPASNTSRPQTNSPSVAASQQAPVQKGSVSQPRLGSPSRQRQISSETKNTPTSSRRQRKSSSPQNASSVSIPVPSPKTDQDASSAPVQSEPSVTVQGTSSAPAQSEPPVTVQDASSAPIAIPVPPPVRQNPPTAAQSSPESVEETKEKDKDSQPKADKKSKPDNGDQEQD